MSSVIKRRMRLQSEILQAKELISRDRATLTAKVAPMADCCSDGVYNIKPVKCLNQFIAILLYKKNSNIVITSDEYEDKGIVIGTYKNCSSLSIGDSVIVPNRGIALTMSPTEGHYSGCKIVFISESSLVCFAEPVKFKVLEE